MVNKINNLFAVVDEYYKDSSLKNTRVIACQHLLWTQKELFEGLSHYWINKSDIHIIWKNYSSNDLVIEELQQQWFDISKFSNIFETEHNFDKRFEGKINEMLINIENNHNLSNESIIFLDDWGHLVNVAKRLWWDKKYDIKWSVEQTSSWYHKVKNLELNFPITHIARSDLKLKYESPHIWEHFTKSFVKKLVKHNFNNPKCLIVWYAAIWQAIWIRLESINLDVTWFDNQHSDLIRKKDWKSDISNLNFIEYYGKNLKEFDVIIGATWNNIINFNELSKLGPRTMLVSASSSDREFPAVDIRKAVWRNQDIHSDWSYENIILTNSWFPITFEWSYHEVPRDIIQVTIAALYASVIDIWIKYQHKINNAKWKWSIDDLLSILTEKHIHNLSHMSDWIPKQ